MADERVERRLAAILAADMVAYSRLMEADEEGTIARQKVHQAELIDPTIAEHEGRIVKLMGDGALVEFPSVVDAVKCAATIQRAMAVREAEVPEDRRILYRIGVNLGDIVIDGDDILGDGVNIAARLESLAEPGGVCISGAAYDQLKATVDVGYADLGEQQVKNIEQPVRVYRLLLDADEAGTVVVETRPSPRRWNIAAIAAALIVIIAAGGLAWWQPWVPPVDPLPPPDNPSIAVLPFDNLSGNPFADVVRRNVVESVTTALSRLPDMSVIARTATFPYEDKVIGAQKVAEELGVRYVLEGSVQQSGDRVRITAQLIDAHSGRNFWRQNYDRKLQDTSALRDEITQDVATALEVNLIEGAGDRIVRGNTNNPEAYSLVRHGLSIFQGGTEEENAEARRMFEKAVELDPDYSIAWHLLGYTHNASSRRGWSEDRGQERARAEELARKAVVIDPSASGPYILLSTISLLRGNYSEATTLGEKAVNLASNDAMTVAHLGQTLVFLGGRQHRPIIVSEAIPMLQRAIRLSPYTPPPILFYEGLGYNSLGQYKEAMSAFDQERSALASGAYPLALFAITSADMGRMDEARVAAQAVLDWNPRLSARSVVNVLDYKDLTKSEHAVATLVQFGLPE